jgi:hypothetical protein
MTRIVGSDLDVPCVFRERPEPIPADMRPLWRLALVLLALHVGSRGGKSCLLRLHLLNWALQDRRNFEVLLRALSNSGSPGDVLFRVEPALNRVVDIALGERLVERVSGDRIRLTRTGVVAARAIMEREGLMVLQKELLAKLGKSLTEQTVDRLSRAR